MLACYNMQGKTSSCEMMHPTKCCNFSVPQRDVLCQQIFRMDGNLTSVPSLVDALAGVGKVEFHYLQSISIVTEPAIAHWDDHISRLLRVALCRLQMKFVESF